MSIHVSGGGSGGLPPGVAGDGATPGGLIVQGRIKVSTDNGNTGVVLSSDGSVAIYATVDSAPLSLQLAEGAVTNAVYISTIDFTNLLTLSAVGALTLGAGVGLFGHSAPDPQPVLATGASHTVDDVITLLQSYGLCKQS